MTREEAMAYVLRQCREFLGTPGTTLPQYEGHAGTLCRLIGEALAGPPADAAVVVSGSGTNGEG